MRATRLTLGFLLVAFSLTTWAQVPKPAKKPWEKETEKKDEKKPKETSNERAGEKNKEKTDEKTPVKPEEKTVEKPDEKPAKNAVYFQQEVNYTIRVKLDDKNHTLSGYEEVQYINNSTHTFRHLYFHLWPNAYKNNETALAKQFIQNGNVDFHYADEKDRGYIDSLFFRADGDSIGWKLDEKNIDICKLYLKEVLKPGDTVTISTPFFVKLPSARFSRLGHLDQSYFITQWYPKPAVYDKNGWNQMPYLNQGEFYSEYGSFDVSITLPANYVVGATGDLFECPEEEKFLFQKWKDTEQRLKNNTNKAGNLVGGDTYPPSSPEWKTIRYKQKNVHDFAWFADKRWNVLRGEHVFDKSDRMITTWAMFTNGNARYWKNALTYINDAVKYYSQWNGEYPYAQVTAVDGTIAAGGGMEYPNVTVIGDADNDLMLETVIMHEVGHNWFYGILGSNERMHGWMDEGINSFNEMRYLRTKYPELKMQDAAGFLPDRLSQMIGLHKFYHDQQYYHAYLLSARSGIDQPCELPSDQFLPVNYGTIMYMKTASAFDYLRAYLGDKVFDKCMHTYFDTWKFKHPQPGDLRRIFENTSKKDLAWFFDGLINSNAVIDYKIKKCKKPDTHSTATFGWMTYEEGVLVENKGQIIAPLLIQGIKADTVQQQRWYFGHDGAQVLAFPNGNYDRIVIDNFWEMPDINRRNNTMKYKSHGITLFRQVEKLRFKFAGELEDPRRTTVYFLPVIGYNVYDGFMPGMAFYNAMVPQKTWEYTLMPMFGTRSIDAVGHADLKGNFNTRFSTWLRSLHWSTTFDRYSIANQPGTLFDTEGKFMRAGTKLQFIFRNKKQRSFSHHEAYVRSTYIQEDVNFDCHGDCDALTLEDQTTTQLVSEVAYTYRNSNPLHLYDVTAAFRNGKNFNLLWAEAHYALRINAKAPVARFRWFGGFYFNNTTYSARYNLRMDGQRGYHDYSYDHIFVGRYETEGLWSRQFVNSYGGFKTPTAVGQSPDWLTALNVDIRLPIPLVRLFADAGISGQNNSVQFLSDAGVSLDFGALDVYFPLFVSSDIQNEYDSNGYKFDHRIRFSLDIRQLNPIRLIKESIVEF